MDDKVLAKDLAISSELLKTVKSGAVDHADMISDGCTNKWSFLSSYYFVGTVVTTLGTLSCNF